MAKQGAAGTAVSQQHPTDESSGKTPVVPANAGPGTAMTTAPIDFEAMARDSQIHFDQSEIAIPFIRVLQSNSPQCTMGDPQYNVDARPGQFINTVTKQRYDGTVGIVVTPIAYATRFTEWKLREQGGGLVKDWGPDASTRLAVSRRDDKNRDITPEGTQIVRGANYYVFVIDDASGDFSPALMVLQGTQLKKSKAFNALIEGARDRGASGNVFKPASFHYGYRLTTAPEKNDKGSWMGVNISVDKKTTEYPYGSAIYLAAYDYRKQVEAGTVKTGNIEDAVEVEAEITPASGAAPADNGQGF